MRTTVTTVLNFFHLSSISFIVIHLSSINFFLISGYGQGSECPVAALPSVNLGRYQYETEYQ